MSDLIKPAVDVPATAADDPRLGHLLGKSLSGPEKARVVLIGFPFDEGVRRNGGRPGAAEGPAAIRHALYRLTPDPENYGAFVELLRHAIDLGDIEPTGELEEAQEKLGAHLAPHLHRGATAIVLGGGHETSFGHFLGYVKAGRAAGVLNLDAHPDVRPLVDGRGHAGSPFRQIIEHPSHCCAGYTVAGLNRASVAKAHVDYLKERGAQAVFNHELDMQRIDLLIHRLADNAWVSFDLDAVDGSAAPGVSAPATGGLPPALWLHAAERAGRCKHVRSIDVVELSPRLDLDNRTARLAAATAWHFLAGLARR
jgi:formiminoglutamase